MNKSSLRASRYEESLSSRESHSRHAPPIVSAAAPITMDYLWCFQAVKLPNGEAIVSSKFAPKILRSVYPRGHQKAMFPAASVIVPNISGLWRYTIILLSFVFTLFSFLVKNAEQAWHCSIHHCDQVSLRSSHCPLFLFLII